ncbi:MAG TPA: sugar ABC transporter permease [Candidatus Sumerlaeota bacterium]|nr:sugar ABC transporter permease [Candidatus Sumerlaeota bacterium]
MLRTHGDSITWRNDVRALPFILPFLAVFAVFIGFPLIYSLWISMHEVTIYSDFYNIFGTMGFVGLKNYTTVMSDPIFWWSVALTMIYAVLLIFPGMALSLGLALYLNKQRRGFGILRSGFFLPNVFDVYVVGIIWLLIYSNNGMVSFLLNALGFTTLAKEGILNNAWTSLPAIALVMVLKNAGFGMILFLTSLNNINESLFEAADIDGCTSMQKLRHVTLPLLKPIIFFLIVTGFVGTLNAFAEIYALTNATGGTSFNAGDVTLQSARISGYHLYMVFSQSMYGEAAAISFILLAIALLLSFFSYKFLNVKDQ